MILRRTLVVCTLLIGVVAVAAEPQPVSKANYDQAFKYSTEYLRQFVYSTSVTPGWIGKTDSFWYSYKTSQGTRYWKVNAKDAKKEPLFDANSLAAKLSEMQKKPIDAATLPITRVSVNDEGTKMKFVTDDLQFEFEFATNKLANLGKAPPAPANPFQGRGGGGRGRELTEEQRRQFEERRREQEQQQDQQQQQQDQNQQNQTQPPAGPQATRDYKNFSPDKKFYVFAMKYNLYLAEPDKEKDAIQITKDGIEDYSFGGGNDDKKARPFVTWSTDSKMFYVTRTDQRGVKELYLVNSLADPRPTLEKYKYPMPGEEAVRKSELYVFDRASIKLHRVAPKWKDEAYSNIHWGKTPGELRFIRRDRLKRHIELCSMPTPTGAAKCLISEGFENAGVDMQPVRYLDDSDEMLWWSERSGWGHYYLYGRDGKFKNAVTSGAFRANRIVSIDPKTRMLYFTGNGREAGENVYYTHLYSVKLDGTGLTLLDPGDASHTSTLSPSFKYVVDNSSRVDQQPVSVLRDATGKKIMDLEQTDLSRLKEVGWKMPETFVVKAADGVTDLYGNMWKPFDFDPNKKYPIIIYVYPGPQQEGVTHTFSAIGGNQQMAQLGFIVIQVGHRGGTPNRSKAYASYGYNNLRDYGLADKKTAIEQLAARHSFIDINRVGIYGHSGGGFMSAAAVLQKPYNEFFKAAVASSGNHDNNIYGDYWAERYHGLKEIPVVKDPPKKEDPKKDDKKAATTSAQPDATTKTADSTAKKEGEGKDEKKPIVADIPAVKFEIKVPTNAELAANLKGALLLVHGEADNNVHPANTMRLVDALIKANKRFDMLIIPGKRHGYGDYQPYFTQRMWDFFSDNLLHDRPTGADILDKHSRGPK